MSRTVSVYVDIDVGDVLDEISDEQLVAALEARNIDAAKAAVDKIDLSFQPLVEEALGYLKAGRADDAMLTLERALYPKWKSPEDVLSLMKRMQTGEEALN